MAGTRLIDLDFLNEVSNSDVLYIVDASEAADHPGKKIAVETLLAGIHAHLYEQKYKPVYMAAATEVAIEVGDLLIFDSGEVYPASMMEDQLSEAANQEYFHDRFAGVALEAKAADVAGTVRVATAGDFTMNCPSGTFEIGDLIGAAEQASGTQLHNQTVKRTPTANRAIGYVVQREAVASTTVLFRIVSSVCGGGLQSVV